MHAERQIMKSWDFIYSVFDYIMMQSPNLNASISIVEIKEILEDNLRQSLGESPPPELELIPPHLLRYGGRGLIINQTPF